MKLRGNFLPIFLSLLPVLVILAVLRVYPIITAIIKSFTNWDGLYQSDWVGPQNYVNFIKGAPLGMILRDTLILMINVPLQIIVGLVFALLLYEKVKGWQRALKIVVPMLVRVIEFAVIASGVWTLTRLFPFPCAITRGGPGYETSTLDYMLINSLKTRTDFFTNQFSLSGAPPQSAGLLLSAVPALIVYIIFQKNIIKGFSLGSIK